jgi:hypothetical protein
VLSVEEAELGYQPFGIIELARRQLAVIEEGDIYNELWRVLEITLRSGAFSRYLRLCPICEKFFVAEDLRDVYCSNRCKYLRRVKDDPNYFRDKMKQSRKSKAARKKRNKSTDRRARLTPIVA